LLGLITALVRYAVETKEAKGNGDPHVAYRIFADGLLDRKSYHLSLLPVFTHLFAFLDLAFSLTSHSTRLANR
jgi:hypothetical protein